jgi:nucleotide-binding universal stress UspA family protein
MADIVVGYDGSDCGRQALEAAIGLAKEMGDRVVVTSSYDVSPLGGEVADMATALEERAEKVIADAAGRVTAAGCEVDTVIVSESAANALAELAEARNARLIVVGTYGDSPLKGAILGSTPHKLLHISKVPVLVVPAK